MLGNRHELHMGVALPADVLDQFVGQLEVGQALAPGANVHFVDAHWFGMHLLLAAIPHPLIVAPDVLALVDDRGGVRSGLREARHGISLEPPDTVGTEHLELVEAACADPFGEQRPDTGPWDQLHVVAFTVPVIEVADESHGLCVRGPDRESSAEDWATLGVLDGHFLGTQAVPALGVMPFMETGEVPASQTAARIVRHECYSCSVVGLASSPRSLVGLASSPGS